MFLSDKYNIYKIVSDLVVQVGICLIDMCILAGSKPDIFVYKNVFPPKLVDLNDQQDQDIS